jgi:hypothetical protein
MHLFGASPLYGSASALQTESKATEHPILSILASMTTVATMMVTTMTTILTCPSRFRVSDEMCVDLDLHDAHHLNDLEDYLYCHGGFLCSFDPIQIHCSHRGDAVFVNVSVPLLSSSSSTFSLKNL